MKKRRSSKDNTSPPTKGKGEISAPMKTGPPRRQPFQVNTSSSRTRPTKKIRAREMEAGPSKSTATPTTTATPEKDASTSATTTSQSSTVRIDPARAIRDGTSTRRLNESTSASKTAITPTAQGSDSAYFPVGKPRGVVKVSRE